MNQKDKPKDEELNAAVSLVRLMERDLKEVEESGDLQRFVNTVKDQFLARRHLTASETEEVRGRATSALLSRMDKMSDNMLLRVIETLARVGDKDIEGIYGILPSQRGPMFALTQNIQGSGQNPSQAALPASSNPNHNPALAMSQVMEAMELLSGHFTKTKQLEGPKRDDDIIDVIPTEM